MLAARGVAGPIHRPLGWWLVLGQTGGLSVSEAMDVEAHHVERTLPRELTVKAVPAALCRTRGLTQQVALAHGTSGSACSLFGTGALLATGARALVLAAVVVP